MKRYAIWTFAFDCISIERDMVYQKGSSTGRMKAMPTISSIPSNPIEHTIGPWNAGIVCVCVCISFQSYTTCMYGPGLIIVWFSIYYFSKWNTSPKIPKWLAFLAINAEFAVNLNDVRYFVNAILIYSYRNSFKFIYGIECLSFDFPIHSIYTCIDAMR